MFCLFVYLLLSSRNTQVFSNVPLVVGGFCSAFNQSHQHWFNKVTLCI